MTTPGLAAPFTPQGSVAHIPLSLPRWGGGGGGTERITSPSAPGVHSVNNLVAVAPDQHRGFCGSVAVSSSDSTGLSGSSVSVHSFSPLVPVHLVSLLQLSQFQAELCDYPDQTAAAYVLTGLQEGFHIGFETSSVTLRSASSNMRSALVHPSVIDAHLETEVLHGRVAGPFTSPPFPDLHISRFGVIPKNNQPGKWHLILDLYSPEGHSDGIPKSFFSVQYVTVDSFIEGIMARGRGTLMAKFDVASAYRNVAVHPQDRPLLGMVWHGKYYVDMALPFGLRSAPDIFTATADLVQWMLKTMELTSFPITWMTFFTLGPLASPVCYNNLKACIQLCSKIGLPLHPEKLEGSLDLNSWDHVVLWAMCCLGFFGFLRAGEFTTTSSFDPSIHLTVGDLQADSLVDPTCFRCFKCSKTDPFRVGCDIYVGRGNSLTCLEVAVGNFLALRGPSPGPLLCYADGHPLTWQKLSSTVQAILHSACYPGSYSGHSFRISAATTAAAAQGIPDHLIKTLG